MNQEGVLISCAVCKQLTQRRCSRCISIYYCSTEHQRQDWRRHKSECIPKLAQGSDNNKVNESTLNDTGSKKQETDRIQSATQINNQREANPESCAKSGNRRSKKSKKKGAKQVNSGVSSKQTSQVSPENTQRTDDSAEQNTLQPGPSSVPDNSVTSSIVYTTKDLNEESAITYEGSSEQEILSESAQQLSTVDFVESNSSNIMRELNRTDPRMISIPSYGGDQPSRVREYPEASLRGSTAPFNFMPNSCPLDPNDSDYETCQRVISDMTQYGVCVLDNFFGPDRGLQVLDDVLRMYQAGKFTPGQLVSSPGSREAQTVRSDFITWVDGRESHCTHIKQLIAKVDGIIIKANKMTDNGKMGDYFINGRTKAMVACYPGSGSHYVKHVDNPNKDGRCITAIYYLNLDWDVRRNGGLLRVFPEGTNQVADIAPIFDRMLFFWSDRRNPHEVQPAFDTRYAITLWYFDGQERAEARRNFRERGQPESNQ